MNGYFERFGYELTEAGRRRSRRPVPWLGRVLSGLRPRQRVALAAATALAVIALALALADGFTPGSDPGGSAAPPAAREPAGPPGATAPPVAGGESRSKPWRLAARPCGRGRVELTLIAAGGTTSGGCEAPRRALTVNERYAAPLRSTFVYGVTTKRVDEVEVDLPRRGPVRVRTRPAPRPAGQPRETGLRVYVARVDGERDPRAVSAYSDGRLVGCAKGRACEDDARADAGGGSGDRTGPASPGGGDPAAGGGGKPPATERRERRRAPGRFVPVRYFGSWGLVAEACGPRPDQVVLIAVERGRKPTASQCGAARVPVRPRRITARTTYLPKINLTVVAGYVAPRPFSAHVNIGGMGMGSTPQRPPHARRARLPRGFWFYALWREGRHSLSGAAATRGSREFDCLRRCPSKVRRDQPAPATSP